MKTRGLTLIEVVIGVSLVSMLIVVFGVSLMAAVYAQRIKLRNMASALADEQLSALQVYDTSQLSNQTNGALIGVLFTQGDFGAVTDLTAPSASQALNAATSTSSGLTSLLPLPKNAYSDFTLTTKFKVNTGSAAGWKAGVLFRAKDLQNHYRAYLTSGSLVLQKVSGNVVTTLYSDARSISQGSWQTLSVTATGSSISVTLNGTLVTTQTDAVFSVGQAALAVWEGASVNFDDVAIGGESWDFDGVTLGELHDDWLRFGLGDLPSGTGTLTISTPFSDTSYKRYSVTISWKDRSGTTRTISHNAEKAN
ncbi:MAG TPA: family 16 glycoside hydrolase [Candidatus Baltobacteraceae bacterium]|nr:family 16 glycoside hydrolase [Candidatus Baltobacteraceae bacterium]